MRGKIHPRQHRAAAQTWFTCLQCKQPVLMQASGTEHRNHCNWCLWSKHLDDTPGDRASECKSAMEPVAVWVRRDGEWAIIHRCRGCGVLHSNRIAGDDDEQALVALALRAIQQPAFPIEAWLPARIASHEA